MQLPNKVISLVQAINNSQDRKRNMCELLCILEEMDVGWKDSKIRSVLLVDIASGWPQRQDEYVDQTSRDDSGKYFGTYYYPIEGTNQYIAIEYKC